MNKAAAQSLSSGKITISFGKPEYRLGDSGSVFVSNTAANTDSSRVDSLKVNLVRETSDHQTSLTLLETGPNTAVFAGNFDIRDKSGVCVEICPNEIIVKPGEIVKATYQTTLKGLDADSECGSPQCSINYSATTLVGPVQSVLGRPYLVTLLNDDVARTTASNIEYKVTFHFKNSNYSLVDIERGDFDAAYAIGENTVVFSSATLSAGSAKAGIVTFHFPENVIESDMKPNIVVNLVTNDRHASGSVDPGGILDVVTEIVKIADVAADVAIKIYQNTVSCFNLDPTQYNHAEDRLAFYDLRVNNCSKHPEEINLAAHMVSSTGATTVEFHFNPDSGDTAANSSKNVILTVQVPKELSDRTYWFHVNGYVILDLMGYKRNVTSSGGDESFSIVNGMVVPEFPLPLIAVIGFALGFGILSSKFFFRAN